MLYVRGELLLWIELAIWSEAKSYIEWSVFQLERCFKLSSTRMGIRANFVFNLY